MTETATSSKTLAFRMVLLAGLGLSIGWGIRGQYGHEHGAMMPGALAAMAAVLMSGRADWHRRIAYFAAFGAVGWAFGGSMSYGHVLAYTHSGHPPTVVYGFASLYLIGFCWAAIGGAATALPVHLNRRQLAEFVGPVLLFFALLIAQDAVYEPLQRWLAVHLDGTWIARLPLYDPSEPMNWYDADWSSALLGIVAALGWAGCRRRFDRGSSLVLAAAVGWCVGFLVFPVLLHWRMTPPRGDNWAGSVGMTVAIWFWLRRHGLTGTLWASVMAGVVGGFGFAGADLMQMLWLLTGWDTNWHSVLEQSYGLINGIGIGYVLWRASERAPRIADDDGPRWADWLMPAVVLVLVTFLNARKNVGDWVKAERMPEVMAGLSADLWFTIGYAALGAAVVYLMVRHLRRPVALVPELWEGKGQVLFLLFLWWVCVVNFEKSLGGFTAQRLITEGVIFLNASICTVLVAVWSGARRHAPDEPSEFAPNLGRAVAIGAPVSLAFVAACLGITLLAFGRTPLKFRGTPAIRFGPNATAGDFHVPPARMPR